MFYFKQLVENARRNGIFARGQQIPADEVFFSAVERAHVFVFEEVENEDPSEFRRETANDLPFEVCSFEMFDRVIVRGVQRSEGTSEIGCLLVEDVALNHKRLWTLFRAEALWLVVLVTPEELQSEHSRHNSLINGYLNKLSQFRCGEEVVKERIKIGIGKEKKRVHTIRRIIRVVPKSRSQEGLKPIAGKAISWSHSWEVRGHWRELAGIGKNRDGEYCERGRTWVKEHRKGPENMPVVRKVRYVPNSVPSSIAQRPESTLGPVEGA